MSSDMRGDPREMDKHSPAASPRRMGRLASGEFEVVHPLDDMLEPKCETDNLGYAAMTPLVKWSLFALRGYIIVMVLMVIYRCLQLAKLIN